MDCFLFFPSAWKAVPPAAAQAAAAAPAAQAAAAAPETAAQDLKPTGDDPSLWDVAARHCVSQTRNRPEAVLHVVQKQYNLSVALIGNGSRGTLDDRAKWTMQEPDAFVWHSHSMSSVLRWLSSDRVGQAVRRPP